MRLTENGRLFPDDIANQGFGGWHRNGQLISQCRNKAGDDASVPGPSKKEETREEPAFFVVALSDGLRYRRLSRPSRTTEPTDGTIASLDAPHNLSNDIFASALEACGHRSPAGICSVIDRSK